MELPILVAIISVNGTLLGTVTGYNKLAPSVSGNQFYTSKFITRVGRYLFCCLWYLAVGRRRTASG
jgi:hypothetical protein